MENSPEEAPGRRWKISPQTALILITSNRHLTGAPVRPNEFKISAINEASERLNDESFSSNELANHH